MKQYLDLMRDVVEGFEKAKSQRNFRSARLKLLDAIQLLIVADRDNDAPRLEIAIIRAEIVQAMAAIEAKLALPSNPFNKNPATNLLLRNKLKPTNDGKSDSADNKASNFIKCFFIFLRSHSHAHSQSKTIY